MVLVANFGSLIGICIFWCKPYMIIIDMFGLLFMVYFQLETWIILLFFLFFDSMTHKLKWVFFDCKLKLELKTSRLLLFMNV